MWKWSEYKDLSESIWSQNSCKLDTLMSYVEKMRDFVILCAYVTCTSMKEWGSNFASLYCNIHIILVLKTLFHSTLMTSEATDFRTIHIYSEF